MSIYGARSLFNQAEGTQLSYVYTMLGAPPKQLQAGLLEWSVSGFPQRRQDTALPLLFVAGFVIHIKENPFQQARCSDIFKRGCGVAALMGMRENSPALELRPPLVLYQ